MRPSTALSRRALRRSCPGTHSSLSHGSNMAFQCDPDWTSFLAEYSKLQDGEKAASVHAGVKESYLYSRTWKSSSVCSTFSRRTLTVARSHSKIVIRKRDRPGL